MLFSPVALSCSEEDAGGCSKFISAATAALSHETVVASALVSFLHNVPQFESFLYFRPDICRGSS